MKQHRLMDDMEFGVNRLWCTCGVEIHPDCDVSLASINKAFEDHLAVSLMFDMMNP